MTDNTPRDDNFDLSDPTMAAWAGQSEPDGFTDLPLDLDAMTNELAKAHRKDQRRLTSLTGREVLPSLFVAGAFAALAPSAERPVALLAAALLITGVAGYLAATTIRHRRADRSWGLSVRDQLERRIEQLRHGARLFRNVGWWYFLPFGLAVPLAAYGLGANVSRGGEQIFLGVFFVFMVVAYGLNRRLGRIRYDDEIERLEPLLAEFDRTV